MDDQKILNLWNEASNSKFVTRKWNKINYQSNANFDEGNEIIYNTEAWKYNAYVLVLSGDIVALPHNNSNPAAFKNCATFTECITKIDETTVDDAATTVD